MNPRRFLPRRRVATALSLILTAATGVSAAVRLASPFGDHMVLQQGQRVPVWGTAEAGATVTVAFATQEKATRADATGRWRIDLDSMPASPEPRVLTVRESAGSTILDTVTLHDVLVGEVWLCGGQSNMERQLGPRSGQPLIIGWEEAAAKATLPTIRQLSVTQRLSLQPEENVEAIWTVCSPETVHDFTAVGFFFARDLQAQLGVPIGIIHSSWGGTPAEAWTSAEGLRNFPEFSEAVELVQRSRRDPAGASQAFAERLAAWYCEFDPGSRERAWSEPDHDTAQWQTMTLPVQWEQAGHEGFDGIVWFRRIFELPASWQGGDVELRLSAIDDFDTTWVNGTWVGATEQWNAPRRYCVPAAALRRTGNVVAVRVLDTGGNGGIWDPELPLQVRSLTNEFDPVSLAGPWSVNFAATFAAIPRPPASVAQSAGAPTVLYNGMIAPLVPYAMRGVAFYQGEANADRAQQYRKLFPALIADWRRQWGVDDFPFLFVQIAPFREQPPEIREAQLLAWQSTRRTAMVVTIDVGDANDIHPAQKAPVGARLALAARALAYGENLEFSGPVWKDLRIDGAEAVVTFGHLGGGLVAPGGTLRGFTIAGVDRVFHPAEARIAGDTVVVTSSAVAQPVAVRYGWQNVASGNLFNRVGLPASPFRTDVD